MREASYLQYSVVHGSPHLESLLCHRLLVDTGEIYGSVTHLYLSDTMIFLQFYKKNIYEEL